MNELEQEYQKYREALLECLAVIRETNKVLTRANEAISEVLENIK